MSEVKLINSTQLNTDLTSVANAIRTKGGTSANLAFPAGFVSAIGDIQTGGGGYTLDDLAERNYSGDIVIPNATVIQDYAFGFNNDYQNSRITSISAPNVDKIYGYAFYNNRGMTSVYLPKVTNIGGYAFYRCRKLEALAFPKVTTIGGYTFADCQSQATNKILDFGVLANVPSNGFRDCPADTLILRKSDALVTLNSMTSTLPSVFYSNGIGGTIYIPKVLYDHLGDGTSLDYKAATNWATFNDYGTITWAKIEGSVYENAYADGTPIS